ncbi:lipoyl protein ligase domain-containing protein [Natronolimnobius baerhuensis]|uniref:Lipoate--protein ligase n=1 Tax=Natronolimnobius baerhuensis TaxID=253108 RepID=A0A202E6F9_9EURY|nr:lipoate--protein ligase family protein [Natronolimnobius baerhuensis]OVE83819.1 lipoate--protein ligase [Natronolimnobius baerhuensis]
MVRVVRGCARTIDADRTASERLLEIAAAGEPAIRVWTPHRQVAFGRRDRHSSGYERARKRALEAGFTPVERNVGGRAVAYDGETTLAFARAEPVADFRRGTDERYERVTRAVVSGLSEAGIDLERGEPDGSFCPGAHSLSARPKATDAADSQQKLVGIAQRVRNDAAITAGIVLVDSRQVLATVLESVYADLEVPFRPATVGTIADASGDAEVDHDHLRETLEAALIGDESETHIVSVDSLRAD